MNMPYPVKMPPVREYASSLLCVIKETEMLTNVTCYSKRYLRALATSYWFGINSIQPYEQQSFQVKRFNIIGCKL